MTEKFGFHPEPEENPENEKNENQESAQLPFDINQILAAMQQMGVATPNLPDHVKDQLNALTAMAQGMLSGGNQPFTLPTSAIREISRKALAASGELPVGHLDNDAMSGALRTAKLWVDEVTSLTRPESDSESRKAAQSRSEWINYSLEGWQSFTTPLVEGIAESMKSVMGSIEDQNQQLTMNFPGLTPGSGTFPFDPSKMMAAFMGTMIRTQLGRSIAAFATTVTSAHDAALPLSEDHSPFLIPENVKRWGEGLGIDSREIEIYLALRESAASRLFSTTPWLAEHLRSLVSSYGQGITIDIQSMQRKAEDALSSGEVDINDPASMQNAIAEGVFAPEESERQREALKRLELILALIEGWIDVVVVKAAGSRLPSLAKLQETQRRRRATQSPTQQLFASLVGLEVSPRTIRECVDFWNQISEILPIEERDRLWEEPFALPTSDEVADPQGFLRGRSAPDDLSSL